MPATDLIEGRVGMLDFAVATAPLPGQLETGDLHVVREQHDAILVAAIDGLGHGRDAAIAAAAAAAVLRDVPLRSVTDLVEQCHEAIRDTRGVVCTLAIVRPAERSATWVSVGNVEAVIVREDRNVPRPVEVVMSTPGVVGYQLPILRPATHRLALGDLLVLATDGIDPDFVRSIIRTDPPKLIAARLLRVHATRTDDALVLVARLAEGEDG